MITIEDIVRHERADELGALVSIETPLTGTTLDGHVLPLSGWAAIPGEPPLQIGVYHDGSPAAAVHVDERLDVADGVPGAPAGCGFHAEVLAIGLAESFSLSIVATTSTGALKTLATIRGRRSRWQPPASASAAPAPILATSLGRTGTSWLQHVLGAHPKIAVYPQWPHELSSINFWLNTMRRLVDKPHGLDLPSRRATGEEGTWWLGASPFDVPELTEWYESDFVDLLARTSREGIQSVYTALSREDEPRYFAEKTLPVADTNLMRELFPESKEILLVRDFRDMLTSIRSFNLRRGRSDFGRDQASSEQEYVRQLTSSIGGLRLRARSRPDALVVRYEDLVTEPSVTIARMLTHLDLAASDADVDDVLTRLESDSETRSDHRTSESGAASIGRWRSELPHDLAELANAEWAAELAEFGYE